MYIHMMYHFSLLVHRMLNKDNMRNVRYHSVTSLYKQQLKDYNTFFSIISEHNLLIEQLILIYGFIRNAFEKKMYF